MSTSPIIVAYDGSPNADDAVALGNLLARVTGAPLALVHVYRTPSQSPRDGAGVAEARTKLARRAAEEVLSRGAALAEGDVALEAVSSTTTATGIRTLAARRHAAVVLFGSAQRTLPGRVHPGSAARRLLHGLPCAIGLTPVSFREGVHSGLQAIAVAHDDPTRAAQRSAEAVALLAGAEVAVDERDADLLLVGSAAGAQRGQVLVNAVTNQLIQTAATPVVVVPFGQALRLEAAPASAAA
jgi:nucleotide-binding universal stress UspA family protein